MFSKNKKAKDGLYSYCKICDKEHVAKNYKTPRGRAYKLISTMHINKQGKRATMEKTITVEDILPILEAGHCQLTGLPFDFMPTNKTYKNPHAPSLDRIDSQKGYTKENCRIVLSAVNDALGEYDDEIALPILEAMAKGIKKNAKQKSATSIPKRPDRKSKDESQLGTIPTARTWQDGDDTNDHSGTIQRQNVDHSPQASGSDSMGHGNKQVASPQQINLFEDTGQ